MRGRVGYPESEVCATTAYSPSWRRGATIRILHAHTQHHTVASRRRRASMRDERVGSSTGWVGVGCGWGTPEVAPSRTRRSSCRAPVDGRTRESGRGLGDRALAARTTTSKAFSNMPLGAESPARRRFRHRGSGGDSAEPSDRSSAPRHAIPPGPPSPRPPLRAVPLSRGSFPGGDAARWAAPWGRVRGFERRAWDDGGRIGTGETSRREGPLPAFTRPLRGDKVSSPVRGLVSVCPFNSEEGTGPSSVACPGLRAESVLWRPLNCNIRQEHPTSSVPTLHRPGAGRFLLPRGRFGTSLRCSHAYGTRPRVDALSHLR